MTWQILATAVSLAIPVLGLLNAWLLNQVRIAISTLKIEMLQQRATDRAEMRLWIETDFMRKSEILMRFETLTDRVERLEGPHRLEGPRRHAA